MCIPQKFIYVGPWPLSDSFWNSGTVFPYFKHWLQYFSTKTKNIWKRTSFRKCTSPRLLLNGPLRVEDLVRLVAHQFNWDSGSVVSRVLLELWWGEGSWRVVSAAVASHCDKANPTSALLPSSKLVLGGLSPTRSITVTELRSRSASESDFDSPRLFSEGNCGLWKYFRMSADGDCGGFDNSKQMFPKLVFRRSATGLLSGDGDGLGFGDNVVGDEVAVLTSDSQPSSVFSLGRWLNARRFNSHRSSCPLPNSSLASSLLIRTSCDESVLSTNGAVSNRTDWARSPSVVGLVWFAVWQSFFAACKQNEHIHVL